MIKGQHRSVHLLWLRNLHLLRYGHWDIKDDLSFLSVQISFKKFWAGVFRIPETYTWCNTRRKEYSFGHNDALLQHPFLPETRSAVCGNRNQMVTWILAHVSDWWSNHTQDLFPNLKSEAILSSTVINSKTLAESRPAKKRVKPLYVLKWLSSQYLSTSHTSLRLLSHQLIHYR